MLPIDEFMNRPREVHAVAHGLHDGYFEKDPGDVPRQIDDVDDEVAYYKASYLLAYIYRNRNS